MTYSEQIVLPCMAFKDSEHFHKNPVEPPIFTYFSASFVDGSVYFIFPDDFFRLTVEVMYAGRSTFPAKYSVVNQDMENIAIMELKITNDRTVFKVNKVNIL